MANKFRKLLTNDYVILDGAMGTQLFEAGLKTGEIPELLNINNPQLLINIHEKYLRAGANVIYANTFGANGYKLEDTGFSVEEIVRAGIENAKKACKNVNADALVALDVGPIGQLLAPSGTLSFEAAYEYYKEIVLAGSEADLVVFETQTDLLECKAAILAAKENTDLPIMCTMTFEMNGRTFTGCPVSAMAITLSGLGIDAIGVNCSLGPKELTPIIEELCKWTNLPIAVKPNAGLPDPETNRYDVSPEEFTEYMKDLRQYGIKAYGGCCGTTPEFIECLCDMLKKCGNEEISKNVITGAVCSSTKVVAVNEPRIIGERINPTGKKIFKQALIDNNMDYILNQALEQVNAGADILDVNVGLPGIDEKEMMVNTIQSLQAIVDAPLQIDSTIPEVLEAALRVYNGKPIVNSVNGEEESLKNVLPLVKKYGAAVVGLTLDKDGIPKSADGRFKIAEKIMKEAQKIGIPKEDIYIDCLTLTASAEQDGVMETLSALYRVKHELGLKTVLGVSNISFGLPNRVLVNHIFLTMALNNGLDLAIINPNIQEMTGAVRAYKLLAGIDKNSVDFIREYGQTNAKKIDPMATKEKKDDKQALYDAVLSGLKEEGTTITRRLLECTDSMKIVNEILIPALDKVGDDFEKGTIFLPQLILSAGVTQNAFEEIRNKMIRDDIKTESKGYIVIATVKGDVHDIGKNIVKVLLQNYGYDVIDLGKDVEYEAVVDAVKKSGAKLVGLSALMTTTLVSMKETIKLIHDNKLDCKIMVGGAVLTPEYAQEIKADFYAKDAKESVDIAKRVLG